MRVAGRTVWGAEPEELSLLHVAFYLRSAGSFELLTDVEGGAQQDRLVGGSQRSPSGSPPSSATGSCSARPVRRIEHDRGRGRESPAADLRVRAKRAIVADAARR